MKDSEVATQRRRYAKYGGKLYEIMAEFGAQNYVKTVELLLPLRHDLYQKLGGSLAQKDLLRHILIYSAIQCQNISSYYQQLAKQLVTELVGYFKADSEETLNSRLFAMV